MIATVSLVTICHHTKLLLYFWPYSLFCILYPCDLFYNWKFMYLLIPFTYFTLHPPPLPPAATSLFSISMSLFLFLFLFFSFLSFFPFFRAAPEAYGGSQARGRTRATAVGLLHSHSYMWSETRLQLNTTAHGNTESWTHWARPGIEPATSWFLNRFISTAPRQELLSLFLICFVCPFLWFSRLHT